MKNTILFLLFYTTATFAQPKNYEISDSLATNGISSPSLTYGIDQYGAIHLFIGAVNPGVNIAHLYSNDTGKTWQGAVTDGIKTIYFY